jgi:uncharacterized membrane protein
MPDIGIPEILAIVAEAALLIALPVAVILLVARLWDRSRRPSSGATAMPRDPAIDAIRTRFAKGDIDQAEYERLRSVLQRR